MLDPTISAEEWEELNPILQQEYTQLDDGRYSVQLSNVDDLPEVKGLTRALDRFKKAGGSSDPRGLARRLREAQEIMDRFGDLDPEEAEEAIQRLKELDDAGEGDGDRKEEEIAKIRQALEKQFEKELRNKDQELEERNERINVLTRSVEKREIDYKIDRALDKEGFIPETRAAVRALLKSRKPKVVWDDDDPKGVFVNDLGDEVDIETYIATWAKTDEASPFLPSSGNTGTGSSSDKKGRRSGRGENPFMPETRNLTEQGRLVKENPELAKQYAAQAGVNLNI